MAVLAEPTVVAGLVSAGVAVVTLAVNSYMKSREIRSTVRHTDAEMLSMSEKDFRITLIKDLQQCRDSNTKIQRENLLLEKANIELTRKVMLLEVKISNLLQGRVG